MILSLANDGKLYPNGFNKRMAIHWLLLQSGNNLASDGARDTA